MRLSSSFSAACFAVTLLSNQVVAEDADTSQELTLENFSTKLFWKRPEQGYYDVDVGLTVEQGESGMRIMSMGDLNNDKYNDLVVLDETGTKLTVYYFDSLTKMYSSPSVFELPAGEVVANVIPTNIPQDLQNLIIVANSSSGTLSSRLLYFKQSELARLEGASQQYSWTLDNSSDLNSISLYPGSQPLALDVNGDQAMDLLYQTESAGVKVAVGDRTSVDSFVEKDFFSTFVLSESDNADCKTPNTSDLLSIPNSHSFIDLNGDCLPDLLLTRQDGTPEQLASTTTVNTYYEIYSQVFVGEQSKYCLASQNGKLVDPTDVRSGTNGSAPMPFIEFGDFNRDGMTDMAFSTEQGVLNILYNQYDAPSPKATNLCNDVGNTADLKSKKLFQSYPFSASSNGVTQKTLGSWDDKQIEYNGIAESMPAIGSSLSIPGRLRVADVDLDGYPDFVMTLSFKNTTESVSTEFTRSVILMNQAGADGKRSLAQIKSSDQDSYLSKVIQIAGDTANYVTFIDIDDDGKLDFFLQQTINGVPQLKLLYNNVVTDNFFLKALSVNSQFKKSQNIYNDYTIGASYRFVITDMGDSKLITVGSQRFQSSYMALQMPFAFMGIGRSNNYVETFYAATAIDGKRGEHMWTPIIPNSQLIVFMNSNDETNWGLELFISPTTSLYLIVMVCAVCLCAIGLAIIWLHVKEKQEDAKKREQHFDFF